MWLRDRSRRGLAVFGLAVFGVALSAVVAARVWADDTPHPIELHWRAPNGCPTSAQVIAEIDRLLGGKPASERHMSVDAKARSDGESWVLEMQITDEKGTGERRVSGASCAELGDAAALIIALAYDPAAVAATHAALGGGDAEGGDGGTHEGGAHEGGATTGGDAPGGTAAPPPSPVLTPSPPPVPPQPLPSPRAWAPPPVAPRDWWVSIGPLGGADIGSLPAPAFAVGGTLGVRFHPVVGEVRVRYLAPVEQTVPLRPSTGGSFDLWAIAPRFCLTPWRSAVPGRRRLGDLALDLCAEVDIGQMRGEGFGVLRPGDGTALWIAPAAAADLELTLLEWLGARVDVGVGVPALRPDFVLDAVGVVHRAGPVTGRGDLEIIAVF